MLDPKTKIFALYEIEKRSRCARTWKIEFLDPNVSAYNEKAREGSFGRAARCLRGARRRESNNIRAAQDDKFSYVLKQSPTSFVIVYSSP